MFRTIYFGSSDFSLPGLKACQEAPGYELIAVITTPPQRQGRGLELTPTVVAQYCRVHNIPCFEFPKLDDQAFDAFANLNPEVLVVASYGKMIPERFLKLVSHRFNIHPSLLPLYRGASPLNAPILNGDYATGLSIADVTKDLDAGDLFYQSEEPLTQSSDSEKVGIILANQSYLALREVLEKNRLGALRSVPQDHDKSSYAPKLAKEDGRLTFNHSATQWDRIVRGLKPWPGAFTEIHCERVGLLSVRVKDLSTNTSLGKVLEITEEGLTLQTALGGVELLQVKPAGKKGMSGGDYARGRRWCVGMNLQ